MEPQVGASCVLRMDNGPELTADAFVEWCDERRIALHYIQPGKPDQNAFIERFNRSYRTAQGAFNGPRSGQCWSSLPSNLRPCRLRDSSSFSRSLAG